MNFKLIHSVMLLGSTEFYGLNSFHGVHPVIDDLQWGGYVDADSVQLGGLHAARLRYQLRGDAAHPDPRQLPHPAHLLLGPALRRRRTAGRVQALPACPGQGQSLTRQHAGRVLLGGTSLREQDFAPLPSSWTSRATSAVEPRQSIVSVPPSWTPSPSLSDQSTLLLINVSRRCIVSRSVPPPDFNTTWSFRSNSIELKLTSFLFYRNFLSFYRLLLHLTECRCVLLDLIKFHCC